MSNATPEVPTGGFPRKLELRFEPVFILLSSQILLLILMYYGLPRYYRQNIAYKFADTQSTYSIIFPHVYWFAAAFLMRTCVPILLIWFVLRDKLGNFGYSLRGTFKLAWAYPLLYLLVLPFVIWGATFESFQLKYPLCKGLVTADAVHWKALVLYELAYGMMFLSGESFWRGYILFGLEKYFGYYAIFIMVIPYSMGHFGVLGFGYTGKPFPETMGSILAGLVLGYLALKHRSFWLGVLLHWAVALTMDGLVIYHRVYAGG